MEGEQCAADDENITEEAKILSNALANPKHALHTCRKVNIDIPCCFLTFENSA